MLDLIGIVLYANIAYNAKDVEALMTGDAVFYMEKCLLPLMVLNAAILVAIAYAVVDMSVFLAIYCLCFGFITIVAASAISLWKRANRHLRIFGATHFVGCIILYLMVVFDYQAGFKMINGLAKWSIG